MADQNTTLIVLGFLLLAYLLVNQQRSAPEFKVNLVAEPRVSSESKLVDRTGSDWNHDGILVEQTGLDSFPEPPFAEDGSTNVKGGSHGTRDKPKVGDVEYQGTIAPWTDDAVEKGGPGYRDSYSQLKSQDEIYPNYYNKYEVFTSDYYPWWRNQHFWPYYTRSYNWQYRYPFFSSWRRPYYYNYWASPYYPSRSVLIKPYLRDMSQKSHMRQQLAQSFRRSK